MTTRVQMIIETLRDYPDQMFTARQLAELFLDRYPQDLAEKRLNPRYKTEEDLIVQLAAEIGGERTEAAKRLCPNVATQDKPRPRKYYWQTLQNNTLLNDDDNSDDEDVADNTSSNDASFTEHDLYPMLISYLSEDVGLYCRRIDERRSKNTRGSGGNHWLHPDIVALETLDKGWSDVVRACVRGSNDSFFRLWSFEVKKTLNKSNVRKSFFQAVSNSSWANFAYLVTAHLDSSVEAELQMLSGLHGVGVLLLNQQSLFDSQILIPARERTNIDWLSVNRIVEENQDYEAFIDQVGIYSQTGRLTRSLWNK
ncbi:COG2958 family protein [Psychrobacter sp. FDAARGOS_221]|uniref:COG2958 family protein n=1 Tax=Psychrobacter sp. FDAARGOS_221 TaxID=1975705 RepID=UPI000BB55FC9|nr:HrgA protein [Psychrobacter sp. FDAARGOS_221]PNK60806.1 HrgA protein [Psychrobacter sp. FDAARGOS_221]